MKRFKLLMASLFVGLAAVAQEAVGLGISYDGYEVCGYGKVISLGLTTDSENSDMATVELEIMEQQSHEYLRFRGKDVIGLKKEGNFPVSRQIFSSKFGLLAQAMASGAPVRILLNDTSHYGDGKCNGTIGRVDIRVCRAGLPCWLDDSSL